MKFKPYIVGAHSVETPNQVAALAHIAPTLGEGSVQAGALDKMVTQIGAGARRLEAAIEAHTQDEDLRNHRLTIASVGGPLRKASDVKHLVLARVAHELGIEDVSVLQQSLYLGRRPLAEIVNDAKGSVMQAIAVYTESQGVTFSDDHPPEAA